MVKTTAFNYRRGSQQGSPGNFLEHYFNSLSQAHTLNQNTVYFGDILLSREWSEIGELAQQVKVLVAKAPAAKPVSGNHTVEAKK